MTIPLYTTIETEFMDKLLSAKYALECITKGLINENHLRMVCDAMMKAKTKHPHFADQMTSASLAECVDELASVRHDNDIQENCGCSFADEILQEEILEAKEAFLKGEHRDCSKELCDSIVVLFRMMELNDTEAEK